MSKPRYDWWQQEVWRDVPGYEGIYQVSDFGRVRSMAKRKSGIITLKQQEKKTGYMCVNLYLNGHMKTALVHRLVASAFLRSDKNSSAQVNHIDENKKNNQLSNLEFVSASENANYGTRNERIIKHSDRKRAAEALCKRVAQMSRDGKTVRIYRSIREAARFLNINNGQISNCCAGKKITAGGYFWRYANE